MKVRLQSNGEYFEQNINITLSYGKILESTKKRETRGKWYYEVTHYYGNNYNLNGF